MPLSKIRSLLAAVSSPLAFSRGVVGGDKPGVMVNGLPVFRVSDRPECAAYADLVVEAMNALPELLSATDARKADAISHPAVEPVKAAPTPASSSSESGSALRNQVEAAISGALRIQQGFKASHVTLWSKVIYVAIEPWLGNSLAPREQPPEQAKAASSCAPVSSDAQQDRLEAVMGFCEFMLAKEHEGMPNQYALETLVAEWDKSINQAANGAA